MIIKFYSKLLVQVKELGRESNIIEDFYLIPDEEVSEVVENEILETEDLAQYADYYFDNNEVLSITLSLEKSGGRYDNYWLVANCVLADGVKPDTKVKGGKTVEEALKEYIEGQYSDGWGEGLAQDSLYESTRPDERADETDYADEDGEIPDNWEEMVEDLRVGYWILPWWNTFDFDMIEVEE